MDFPALRRCLWPLRNTPFHPQWLALRNNGERQRSIVNFARGRVLDIGCGDRRAENLLKANTSYIGLDYPATTRKGYPGHPDVYADGQCLPFKDECIDTILLMDVLEHIPSPESVMMEARRVLNHEGRLLIQVPFLYPIHDAPHDFQRWTLHGLLHLLGMHGFSAAVVYSHGTPLQTSTALLAIAIAKAFLDAITRTRAAMLLAPLFVALIPIVNLTGWFLSLILPSSDLMPLSYRIEAVKVNDKDPADID